jgi:hypothetical protein
MGRGMKGEGFVIETAAPHPTTLRIVELQRYAFLAPTERNEKAQGNALGTLDIKDYKP